jgi:hypothetical protein
MSPDERLCRDTDINDVYAAGCVVDNNDCYRVNG